MTSCQRWRDRRASYRPAGEIFNPASAEVHAIDELGAKAFVCRHHYAGTYPAARFRVGLFVKRGRFLREQLAGAAVFSVPMSQHIIPRYFGIPASQGVELGRLVLLDELEANAESWFVARAFKLLRGDLPEIDGVLAYSDPIERITASGEVVKRGHLGIVYQALNASYRGRSRAQPMVLARDGRIVGRRALMKLKHDDVGAGYAYQQLRSMGAPARLPLETGPAYLARALTAGGFRRQHHPGNHTYTWWLGARRARPHWASMPYPKW